MSFGTRNGRTGTADGPPLSLVSPPQSPAASLPTVLAVEFIRRMRGASQPCLVRGADGAYYVVKVQNNPQHARILANEMFAARLAGLVGLPVPRPAFIEVPEVLIRGNPEMVIETGARFEPCAAGMAFGSSFPGDPGSTLVMDFLPDRLLRKVRRLAPTFLGAFVFDKWTCNCNGRQMIFTRSAGDENRAYIPWLIDQGFCFNDGEWDFPDSPIRNIYPRRLVYESVRGLESFEPYLTRIENLEDREIEECTRDIPEEWCAGNTAELRRLAERVSGRRRRLRQAIIDAKNCDLRPFPNWL
jgi:HipA-like protein